MNIAAILPFTYTSHGAVTRMIVPMGIRTNETIPNDATCNHYTVNRKPIRLQNSVKALKLL